MIEDYISLRIKENIDLKYKKFHSSLIPNIDSINGVRIPILRNIAKEVSKKEDVLNYLDRNCITNYEETVIYGLVIGNLKLEVKDLKKYLNKFIPYIDNWATCDIVASNLKIIKKNKKEMYPYITKLLLSKNEFTVRFGIVLLMDYYLDDYINVLPLMEEIKHDGYYVKMAISWLISICYIKHKKATIVFLKNNNLDTWTHNKAIQKIRESNAASKEEKDFIVTFKK